MMTVSDATTVLVNGCSFACRNGGRGANLVFIHGEIHGGDYWAPQVAAFGHDHRYLVYERRGHNGSEGPGYGYSVENQTRDLEGLLDHFGMDRVRIIALAFGTTIAANFAIRNPDRVEAMVLGAWSELHDARSYLKRWETAGARAADAVDRGGRQGLVDLLRIEGGRTMFLVIPPEGSPHREAVIQLMSQHPAEHYRRGMLEVASSVPDLAQPLSQLAIPTLGICGEVDPFPDEPAVLAGMATFREAPRVPGGGRFAHMEQPEHFNAAVRAFFEAAGRR